MKFSVDSKPPDVQALRHLRLNHVADTVMACSRMSDCSKN